MKYKLVNSRITICFLFFINLGVYLGQNTDELDIKYTPSKSSIFNNLNKKNISSASDEVDLNYIVKFNVTSLFRRKVMFDIEGKVVDGLVIRVGFGKAFGKDIIESVGYSLQSSFDVDKTASPEEIVSASIFNSSSPKLAVGLKYFFSGVAFDGFYTEINYYRETVNYTVANIAGFKIIGSNNAYFKTNGFFLNLGGVITSGKNNNIIQEFSFGVGLKSVNATMFKEVETININGNPEKAYYKTGSEISFKISPSINLTYSFGFGF